MKSRDAMLRAIRAAQPAPVPLPDVPAFTALEDDAPETERTSAFAAMVESIGGRAVEVPRAGIAEAVGQAYPDVRVVASRVAEVEGTVALGETTPPRDLATVELLVCEGALGVAENGAVWLGEATMGHRAAPFIAQHVALVLEKSRIVRTMHEAYAHLDAGAEGFGVFVAGPSKTADIEQSLVIGAHGPRSLLVLLV